MSGYWLVFKTQCMLHFQYRAAALAGIFTQFAFGFMRLFVMIGFYTSYGKPVPLTLVESISYIWLTQVLLTLLSYRPDPEMHDAIQKGNLAYELIRPMNISLAWFSRALARRGMTPLMRGLPLFLCALLMPKPYSLVVSDNPKYWIAFMVSVFLSWLVATAITNMMNVISVCLNAVDGLVRLLPIIAFFFSGLILPLPLFPASWQTLILWLPFAGVMDTPIQIVLGRYQGVVLFEMMGRQVMWGIILMVLADWVLKQQLKKAVLQGG